MYLFTYGTLTSRRRMEELVGRVVAAPRPARLRGFRLLRSPPLDYPLILPDPDGEVSGFLYELEERDLPPLDHYEGLDDDPPLYFRQPVTVECEGREVRAQAYVGNPAAWPAAHLRADG